MNGVDYLVVFLILLVPLIIGFYFGYKNKIKACISSKIDEKTTKTELKEYLVAGSAMSSVPIAFSLLATFVSTTTLLGTKITF